MAIAFVQGQSRFTNINTVAGGTAGNIIILGISWASDYIPSYQLTNLTSFTPILSQYSNSALTNAIGLWYAYIIANGTYEISDSNNYVNEICIGEFSGCATSNPVDGYNQARNISGSNADSPNTGNITVNVNELVITFGLGSGFTTPPSGFSYVQGTDGNLIYQIATYPTANPTWTGSSTQWADSGASIKVFDPHVYMTGSCFGVGSVIGSSTQKQALSAIINGVGSLSAGPLGESLNAIVHGTATVTGTMLQTIPMSAIVNGSASLTGKITQQQVLSGISQGTTIVSGNMIQNQALISTVNGVGVMSGNNFGIVATLEGTAQGTASVSDSNLFNVTIPINSVSYGVASSTGDMNQIVPMNSVCYGAAIFSDSITSTQTTPIAATVNGIASVTGNMNQYVPLNSVCYGIATLPNTFNNNPTNNLVGTVNGVATISGAMNSIIPITATVYGVATSSGTENAIIPLVSIVNGVASVSGNSTQGNMLAGTIQGTGSAYAALNVDFANYCVGSIQGTATVSGTMNQIVPMSATAYGVASAAAVVNTTVFVSGEAYGVASASATASFQVSGSVQGTASVFGDMNAIIPLVSEVYGIGSVSGELAAGSTTIAYGKATVTGTMNTQVFMSGTVQGTATPGLNLNTTRFIAVNVQATASVTGNASSIIPLQSSVYGQSIVSGAANSTVPLNAKSQGTGSAVGDFTQIDMNVYLSGIAQGIGSGELETVIYKPMSGIVYGVGSGSLFVPVRHGNIFKNPLEEQIYLMKDEQRVWVCPIEKRITKI